jgi:hypothetical protein
LTGLVAAVGIRDRFLKGETLQAFALSALTAASVAVGITLTYQKVQADQRNRIIQAALNIRPSEPFRTAILVFGIPAHLQVDELARYLDPDGNVIEEYTIEHLFMHSGDQLLTGSLMLVGAALPRKDFSFSVCGKNIIIEENTAESTVIYASAGLQPETDIESCGLSEAIFSSPEAPIGSWIFEHIAGSTGHIIDVRSEMSAQMVIDLIEQENVLAILEVRGMEDADAYRKFIENVIDLELKFYQNFDSSNPLGEGCTSVYIIPLVADIEVLAPDSVQVSISPGANGTFRRCELVPI